MTVMPWLIIALWLCWLGFWVGFALGRDKGVRDAHAVLRRGFEGTEERMLALRALSEERRENARWN